MSDRFRLTLAQINPTVGDLRGNAGIAHAAWDEAKAAGADMIAFPEMFITGYQLQDLVKKPAFAMDVQRVLQDLAADCADGPAIGIGGPLPGGAKPFNAYFVLQGGKIDATVLKHHLPNYAVFDEKRYYYAGDPAGPVRVGPVRIGMPICEDAWFEDVTETLAETGAEILLVPNGSPYHRGKMGIRQAQMVARVIETGLPLVYLNLLGGQDDQVFDGASFVLNPHGVLTHQLPAFEPTLTHVDFERGAEGWQAVEGDKARLPDAWEADYHAMVLALGDYMRKAGFSKTVLGLSGGVDSALVAAIAADALAPENVRCVMLPSKYTSAMSLEDAGETARRLGCKLDTVSIAGAHDAVGDALSDLFAGMAPDVTEENIQSRLRGVMLMAISNKFGEMLLTTGNKSEVAVGYSTIYGDMAGGYNPIKDLYKTRVFETCRWRNANHRDWMAGPEGEVIPPRVIDKPPTAELREDQKDEDSLPPYSDLDVMLEMLIDKEASVSDVVAMGYDRATVKKIESLIYINEYKRFQAAPGARLTERAFWLDRRYPIVNRWRDTLDE
ncbi:NAD synthetase / Glutamine amidotransferase chain of NAD synthetase [Roseibacterium elongatum DSM 19469]|uniref:Glutamine-dependent NAD(+) synthetase n=1 Tax=Roseicyclus elongatus DSM 19469 TaxID=1294273 RepID=W8SP80_9RHOB|nr:NAD+ synthase [Roseibacterium elongatum]AHM04335.1 NAD synthetase / Glutamine amidotransferase chain of NAD synthetase [Roseibacterium elongatum DSM 19469]